MRVMLLLGLMILGLMSIDKSDGLIINYCFVCYEN